MPLRLIFWSAWIMLIKKVQLRAQFDLEAAIALQLRKIFLSADSEEKAQIVDPCGNFMQI